MWGAFRMSAPLGVMLRGGQSCVCIELTTGHGLLDVAIQKKTLPNCATAGFLADKGDCRIRHVPLSLFSHADEVIE